MLRSKLLACLAIENCWHPGKAKAFLRISSDTSEVKMAEKDYMETVEKVTEEFLLMESAGLF
ncbi:MAG: hypothetical protein ABIE94_01945 [archaeon]